MNKKVLFDYRWAGNNGIGRFTNEVTQRIPFLSNSALKGSPTSIFGLLKSWIYGASSEQLIYSPGYIPPSHSYRNFIFTIHDLNHIDTHHNSSIYKKLFYRIVIKRGVHNAIAILTVSDFSKKRIIEWTGCNPNKIKVVGNGISSTFTPEPSTTTGVDNSFLYFFCCSNRKGHKNENNLLSAYRSSDLYNKFKLVFTGNPTSYLIARIKAYGLIDRVLFTGFITDNELAHWYKGAVATVFPSLYEGFGLPVLESMACGTPVITSNITSMPEVGGDAAYYVDPYSIESIAHGMRVVAEDENLRNTMREKGLIQAKKFSWDKTASLVEEALLEALNKIEGK